PAGNLPGLGRRRDTMRRWREPGRKRFPMTTERRSVHRLSVQVDVEAFDLLLRGDAQADHSIDQLEDDEGCEGTPGHRDQASPKLGQDLAGIAVDQALLAVAADRL